MPNPANIPARKRDRILALFALVTLLVLGTYHVADVRGAFEDFDTWWTFFKPQYPGDDYAEALLYTNENEPRPQRYRAITLGLAMKRSAPDAVTMHVPVPFSLLIRDTPETPPASDVATLNVENFRPMISQLDEIGHHYDPRLDDSVIQAWRDQGLVTDLAWGVSYLPAEKGETALALFTDSERRIIYVVPKSLWPIPDLEGMS